MARPSDYNEDIALEICIKIADGLSLRSICLEEGMPSKTSVFRWLEKHEAFRDQYARARVLQADALFDDILDISDDGTNDWIERKDEKGEPTGHYSTNGEAIQRSRLRVDTRKWMAGKLRPKKYGERQELDLKSSDGSMTPDKKSDKDIAKAILFALSKGIKDTE